MNIIFSWFACIWKSESMVVTLLKSMSLSVVNRSQLRKWTSSSRISHLGHSHYMDRLGPFSTILIRPNGTKCVMNLSWSPLDRFTRLKGHVKAFGLHICTMEPFTPKHFWRATRPWGLIYTAITGPIVTIQKLYEMMHVDSVISSRRLKSHMKVPELQI